MDLGFNRKFKLQKPSSQPLCYTEIFYEWSIIPVGEQNSIEVAEFYSGLNYL